jgi:hypothetical protein
MNLFLGSYPTLTPNPATSKRTSGAVSNLLGIIPPPCSYKLKSESDTLYPASGAGAIV